MTESSTEIVAAHGIVKWFDSRKGFGFVVGPDGQDIFIHFSCIEGDGFRALKDGSAIEYDATKGEKGWRASRVVRDESVEVTVVQRRTHARTSRQ